jgi:hypothetical protein
LLGLQRTRRAAFYQKAHRRLRLSVGLLSLRRNPKLRSEVHHMSNLNGVLGFGRVADRKKKHKKGKK